MKQPKEIKKAPGWPVIRRHLVTVFSTVFVFSLFVNLFVLSIPIYSLQIFDRVTVSQSSETLLMLFILVCICLAAMIGFEILRRKVLRLSASSLSDRLTHFSLNQQGLAAQKLTSASSAQEQRLKSFDYETLSRVTKNIQNPVVLSLMDALLTPAFIALLFFLHPAFGLVTCVINIILMVLCRVQFSLIKKQTNYQTRSVFSSLNWLVSDYNSHWAQGREEKLIAELSPTLKSDQHQKERQAAVHSRLTSIVLTIRNCGQIAIPTVGAMLLIQQHISPGIMLAAMILSMKGLIPWEQVFHGSHGLNELLEDLKALKLSTQLNDASSCKSHTPITALTGKLSISLPSNNTTQTIDILPGTTTAIIGPNGSGKTSLLHALIGLPHHANFAVDACYDEHRISNIDRRYLAGKISYIPCTSAVPHISVRELLCHDDPSDRDFLYEVCQLLGLHKRLLMLPMGYDTIIDQHPMTRSSGVLHLLMIARALYSKPQFVFIDNLDATFDKAGVEAFEAALTWLKVRGASAVITTQRKSLLGNCDHVLLCDQEQVFHFSHDTTLGSEPRVSTSSRTLEERNLTRSISTIERSA
ncbi:MAG: ATP-binding cassette domain-containing protein [Cellvibrionaceae bacterium]